MFGLLRAFTAKKVPRGLRLLDDNGMMVETEAAEQQLFRSFFGALGAGGQTTFAALAATSRPMRTCAMSISEDPSIIPSRTCVALDLASAKLQKAVGESVVGAEAFKVCADVGARILHPLVLKSVVNAEAPLQWKGSQLLALFKGKGTRTATTSYRDVSGRPRC